MGNDRTGKKFTLFLKTTYKKVFLKYKVNTRFPSLFLASDNAIFGGGRKPRRRRRKKKKKKKVGKPIGDPVRGRDAPINIKSSRLSTKHKTNSSHLIEST